MADRLETFRGIPLFAGLPDSTLSAIIDVATEFDAPANQVLVQPGLEGSGMFVLEEGSVLVESHGQKIRLGPGEFFGEMALLTEGERTARVRTETDVRCLAIARTDFERLIEADPRIAVPMLRVLARRLAEQMR